jgi:riboflavin synthase
MFTGIVTDIGELVAREAGRFMIRCAYPAAGIAIGASIACDGACLTATAVAPAGSGAAFTVDVSNETLARTTLGEWRPGRRLNLERALRAGDELGGHIVSGHVDGLARLLDMRADGDSRRMSVEAPPTLARFIAAKVLVALVGLSFSV